MWTRFYDLHSGGYSKTNYDVIFIEGDETTTVRVFEDRLNMSPYAEACPCCGYDFLIDQEYSLREACKWDRARYGKNLQPMNEFVKRSDILIIYADGRSNHPKESPNG